ncbi:type I-C CRISPR-associated endonuclease Cas1c [bacterium]|nr:type I-C CRISPR-associated endonuclease Cas1c [bacterium]
MKHLLNTLFVTTQGAYLARDRETLLVRVDGATKLQLPIHTLGGIVCFGRVGFSPQLLGLCGERNVLVSFLSERGRFLARLHGPVTGNVLLRREQYRVADDSDKGAEVARAFVAAKIANCRVVLQRAVRDRPLDSNSPDLAAASSDLAALLRELKHPLDRDRIRGNEGRAANIYFAVFDHLIVADKQSFNFGARNRRPPLDRVNAMLSFVYTLLAHDVTSALEGVGLDPAVGFLHTDRPGRMSLALDLMEEFRPVLADRTVLSLINLRQVSADGFRVLENGAVLMDDNTRRQLLVSWQKKKQEEVLHPFLGEKIPVGLLPHVQAMLLARFLRGDTDAYPPFFWK